jgi:hypothetical protein
MTDDAQWCVEWNTNRDGDAHDVKEGQAWCNSEEDKEALVGTLVTSRYIHSIWITDPEGAESQVYA